MEIIKLANDVITTSQGGSLADTCQDGCFSATAVGTQDAADEC